MATAFARPSTHRYTESHLTNALGFAPNIRRSIMDQLMGMGLDRLPIDDDTDDLIRRFDRHFSDNIIPDDNTHLIALKSMVQHEQTKVGLEKAEDEFYDTCVRLQRRTLQRDEARKQLRDAQNQLRGTQAILEGLSQENQLYRDQISELLLMQGELQGEIFHLQGVIRELQQFQTVVPAAEVKEEVPDMTPILRLEIEALKRALKATKEAPVPEVVVVPDMAPILRLEIEALKRELKATKEASTATPAAAVAAAPVPANIRAFMEELGVLRDEKRENNQTISKLKGNIQEQKEMYENAMLDDQKAHRTIIQDLQTRIKDLQTTIQDNQVASSNACGGHGATIDALHARIAQQNGRLDEVVEGHKKEVDRYENTLQEQKVGHQATIQELKNTIRELENTIQDNDNQVAQIKDDHRAAMLELRETHAKALKGNLGGTETGSSKSFDPEKDYLVDDGSEAGSPSVTPRLPFIGALFGSSSSTNDRTVDFHFQASKNSPILPATTEGSDLWHPTMCDDIWKNNSTETLIELNKATVVERTKKEKNFRMCPMCQANLTTKKFRWFIRARWEAMEEVGGPEKEPQAKKGGKK